MRIPYVDFKVQLAHSRQDLLSAFENVLESGHFIQGPRSTEFEKMFAERVGASRATGVSNGTCSLRLIFEAMGVSPDHEVITAPNSFFASAASIDRSGARIRFADVGPDGNLSASEVRKVVATNTLAILPVHLAGRPVNMHAFDSLQAETNIPIIEDAAQAIGSCFAGRRVGGWGYAASFSFHPLKTLHCFGDGGIVTSGSAELVERIRLLKNHGLRDRETCEVWSSNCRLDELQASLLLSQIAHLDSNIRERQHIASEYNEALADVVKVPTPSEEEFHSYQSYVIQTPFRDELWSFLRERGVEVLIHYPTPLHLQEAGRDLGYGRGDFPEAERYCSQALSLPIYPGMPREHCLEVIELIRSFPAFREA